MYLDLHALRILVVDDNKHLRTIVGSVLMAAGVGDVQYAGNGADAMKVLKRGPIDLAFVDYEMPGMNGLDLISEIRALDGHERFMPIIVLTGYADMKRVKAALDRGMTEFLRKPVAAKDIMLRLQSAILNARPFVAAGPYFGPDRRRRKAEDDRVPRRRAADREAIAI